MINFNIRAIIIKIMLNLILKKISNILYTLLNKKFCLDYVKLISKLYYKILIK